MVAYFVADQREVTDPETMKNYIANVAATVDQYGGKFIVRGGDPEVIEGEWPVRRVIVMEFTDRAAARAWYDSPEYAELKKMRWASTTTNLILVDGA
ncbi:MAG: D-fructose-6-phosphate amidotransferase [Rhodospirillaceae bacterium]|nr:D-fructose-6-phosphate amidotransferase [Rhodospirillaceae bacterium]